MSLTKDRRYRNLYKLYLSEGKGSLRAFSRKHNICNTTVRLWFQRFDLENGPNTASLVPFTVIPEQESIALPDIASRTLLNLQLTTPNGIIVIIPEITIPSLSSLVKSLIE